MKHPNPDGLASPFTAEYLDQAKKYIEDTKYLILHIFALLGDTIVRILHYLDLQNKQRTEGGNIVFFVNGFTLWTFPQLNCLVAGPGKVMTHGLFKF